MEYGKSTMKTLTCCRVSWHLGDVVDILRDLRWGEVQFGNLRYRNYSHWCLLLTLCNISMCALCHPSCLIPMETRQMLSIYSAAATKEMSKVMMLHRCALPGADTDATRQ